MRSKLRIEPVNSETQYMAKQVILQGLFERFGYIDPSLNPDIDSPVEAYISHGQSFLVGFFKGLIIATGALVEVASDTGQIKRLSVLKGFRHQGFATQMLEKLEDIARQKGYTKLYLETNQDWDSAIQLYLKLGYQMAENKGNCFYFTKFIHKERDIIG